MHLFVGSMASWEPMPISGAVHEEMSAFAELLKAPRS